MAHHNVALDWLMFSINILLLHIITQLTPVSIASSDQFSPVIECVEVERPYWWPPVAVGSYWWPKPEIRCNLQCSRHCTCSLGNFSEVFVNCTTRNVSIVQVIYPPNVTHLSWADNDLSGIGKDSFSEFTDLQELDLSSNFLTEICPGTFSGLKNLLKLDLNNNLLKQIQQEIFSGLANLNSLNLENNALRKIQPGTFEEFVNLDNLLYLYLGGNMLEQIQRETFSGLANLNSLALWDNSLREIHPRTFEELANLTDLFLSGNILINIQPGTFKGLANLRNLYLNRNMLKRIQPGTFSELKTLNRLEIRSNLLTVINPGAFEGLKVLKVLDLTNSGLKEISPGVFEDMKYLEMLLLQHIMLKEIHADTFRGLSNLQELYFNFNSMLKDIHANAFRGLLNLSELYLDDNNITSIQSRTFGELTNLTVLNLNNNPLSSIHPDLFQNLSKLEVLLLFNTGLKFLPDGIFCNMPLLQHLNLARNNLNELRRHPFKYSTSLFSVDLSQNPLLWIQHASFDGQNSETQVFVDHFATCCYVTKWVCFSEEPQSEFLSCGRMLPYNVIRCGIWVVSILAVFGNIFSLVARCKHWYKTNRVQFLIIANLSISDFLMGVYLIFLLSADLYYAEYFPSHSELWRNSTLCKIAGSLSVLSSEASVFFITLISLDRFLCVKYPRNRYLSTKTSTCIIISTIWLLAFVISITTLILTGVNSNFYSVSEICVGLPISRDPLTVINQTSIRIGTGRYDHAYVIKPDPIYTGNEVSMYFSIAIFTGLNLACFLIVGFCYTAILIFVRLSSKRAGQGAISNNEIRMAKKLFLLVLTDFCCWVPIGVLSILVQAGAVEVDARAYAWIATFVLPINSALNPFLYTLGDVISDKKFTCKCCKKHNTNQVMPLEALNG